MLFSKLCAFALVALTTAFSPDIAAFESKSEVVDHRNLGGDDCDDDDDDCDDKLVKPKFNAKLKAEICNDDITASVKGKEDKNTGTVTWTIDIDAINTDICNCPTCDSDTGNLNWHIHQKRVLKNTCGDTGGHWDSALACGPKSHFAKTSCKGQSYTDEYSVRCARTDKTVDGESIGMVDGVLVGQAGCEYGDLSGKMGQIVVGPTGKQTFEDTHIEPLETYKYTSIVFHCGGPRVACADFEFDD